MAALGTINYTPVLTERSGVTSGKAYQNQVNITNAVSTIERKARCNPDEILMKSCICFLMKHIQRLNLIPEGMTRKIR